MTSKNNIILIDDVPLSNVADSLKKHYGQITIFKNFNSFFENYQNFTDNINILLVDIQFNTIDEEAGFNFLKIFYNLRRIFNKYMINEIEEQEILIKHYLSEILNNLSLLKVKSAGIIPGFKNVKLQEGLNSKLITKLIEQNYDKFLKNIKEILNIDNFKIFISSYFDSLKYIKKSKLLQAKGYIHKNSGKIENLPQFLEENINNEFSLLIDDNLLINQCFKNNDRKLTDEELLILKLKAAGKTYKEIINFFENKPYLVKNINDKIDKNFIEKKRASIENKLAINTNNFDKVIVEAFKQKVITPEDIEFIDILL